MAAKRKTTPWWRDELGVATKGEVEVSIRMIVAKYPNEASISDKDCEFLHKVLRHHYQYDAKVGCGVARIEVRSNPSWNGATRGLWFVRLDGSEVDISWVVALKPDGRPSVKEDATTAARYEIYPQIHQHHAEGACATCPLCGEEMQRGVVLHVDHEVPFDTLFADFLAAEGASYDAIDVEDLGLDSRFADRALAQRWQDYHRANAKLRLTHADCNLSRGRMAA